MSNKHKPTRLDNKKSKVVEFQPSKPNDSSTTPPPSRQKSSGVVEVRPTSPVRQLLARVSTLRRQTDQYAQHLYEDEPDILEEDTPSPDVQPHTDQERASHPKAPWWGKRLWFSLTRDTDPPPADTQPSTLARRYARGQRGRRVRLTMAFLCVLPMAALTLPIPLSLTVSVPGLTLFQLKSYALTLLLFVVGLLCMEVLTEGFGRLFTFRPQIQTMGALAWVFTLIDGGTAGLFEGRDACPPCATVTALGLVCALWGQYSKRAGGRLSARCAAQTTTPHVAYLDENRWNGQPAYSKAAGTMEGFGSHLQRRDASQRVYQRVAPLLLVLCVGFALAAAGVSRVPGRILWGLSVTTTAAHAFGATLAYARPFYKLARRLASAGGALCGWSGARNCTKGGVILSDQDLFPLSAISIKGCTILGGADQERVISYTASMIRAMNCGLTKTYHQMLRHIGSIFRSPAQFHIREGGVLGTIQGREVWVGNLTFLRQLQIPVPKEHSRVNNLYCVIDGELCGVFVMSYKLADNIRFSLLELIRNGVEPILATRDPLLTPKLLETGARLSTTHMSFPKVNRRYQLTRLLQIHSYPPIGILCHDRTALFTDVILAAKRLRTATYLGVSLSVCASVLGVLLTGYLAIMGAYNALTPTNLLLYMVLWLLPQMILTNWVNRF